MAIIASIQPFSITISSGNTSNTATISSVDTSRASIVFNGSVFDNTTTAVSHSTATLQLTNGTTVTATRTGTTGNLTVRGCVVEWTDAACDSVQQGTIDLDGGTSQLSNTATISSVTTTDSAAFNLGHNAIAGSSSTHAFYLGTMALTNATTVTFDRGSSTGTADTRGAYVVVEWASGVLNSNTQARSVTKTTSSLTDTDTISAITMAQTMLAWGGIHTSSTTETTWQYGLALTSTTGTTATRTGTSTTTRTYKYTVVEFKSADITGVDRGSTTAAGTTTTGDATIGAVNLSFALANWLGNYGSGDNNQEQLASVHLTSTTNVRVTKGGGGSSDDTTASWEVIEFSTVTVDRTASASITEEEDTLSAAATVRVTGSLSATEENDTLSASATVKVSGSLSATEENDTLAAASAVRVTASLASTEQDDSLEATATATDSRTLSASIAEEDDSLSSSAQVRVTASVNTTEEDDSLAAQADAEDAEPVEEPLTGGGRSSGRERRRASTPAPTNYDYTKREDRSPLAIAARQDAERERIRQGREAKERAQKEQAERMQLLQQQEADRMAAAEAGRKRRAMLMAEDDAFLTMMAV